MSEMHAVHENAKIKDYSTINPDIALKQIEEILTELVINGVTNQTLEYVKNNIIDIINRVK